MADFNGVSNDEVPKEVMVQSNIDDDIQRRIAQLEEGLSRSPSMTEPSDRPQTYKELADLYKKRFEGCDMVSEDFKWYLYADQAYVAVTDGLDSAGESSGLRSELEQRRSELVEARRRPLDLLRHQLTQLSSDSSADQRLALHEKYGDCCVRDRKFFRDMGEREAALSQESISHYREAISIAGADSATLGRLYLKLGSEYYERLVCLAQKKDALLAVDTLTRALELQPVVPKPLGWLSEAYRVMGTITYDAAAYETAIDFAQRQLDKELEYNSNRGICDSLTILAFALYERARAFGFPDDIDIAIELTKAATTYWNHPYHDLFLSMMHHSLFLAREDQVDLDKAIDLARSLLPIKAYHVQLEGRWLLGQILVTKFQVSGAFEDAKLAWDCLLEDLRARPRKGNPRDISKTWMAISILSNESNQFGDETIRWIFAFHAANRARAALDPIARDWQRTVVLVPVWNHLANLHGRRSKVLISGSDDELRMIYVQNSLRSLTLPCPLFGSTVDTYLGLVGSDEGRRREAFRLLGRLLKEKSFPWVRAERFHLGHTIAHLHRPGAAAVAHFRTLQEVMRTSNITETLSAANCLGKQLAEIAYGTKELTDYEAAISYFRSHDDNCQRTDWGRLYMADPFELPRLLFWKFQFFPEYREDGEESLRRLMRKISLSFLFTLDDQIDMLRKAARLQVQLNHDEAQAEKLRDRAAEVFEEGLMEGNSTQDIVKIIRISRISSEQLAADAIFHHLDPRKALKLLESMRNVVWNNSINALEPLDGLALVRDDLAKRLQALRQRRNNYKDYWLSGKVWNKHIFAREYTTVVREIRTVPGFESFLRPDKIIDDLGHTFGSTALISICTDQDGTRDGPRQSWALVAHQGKIEHLDLPLFPLQLVELLFRSYQAALKKLESASRPDATPEQQHRAENIFQLILGILWICLAEPILNHLRFRGPSTHPHGLPRVIWMSSGWLGMLPLHIAGIYDKLNLQTLQVTVHPALLVQAMERAKTEPCTVHDRVISSFVPGIKVLDFLRRRKEDLSRLPQPQPQRAMLVGVEATPLKQRLPLAAEETRGIEPSLRASFEVKPVEASTAAVMATMEDCGLLHFACHSDHGVGEDPFLAQLCMQDWHLRGREGLNVANIMRMNLNSTRLAYLSCCDGAVVRDQSIRSEGIHLAGAFQMAGVPSVIATWWPVRDDVSMEAAKTFYKDMQGDDGKLRVDDTASVLHDTISALRQKYGDVFHWGSIAHFGI